MGGGNLFVLGVLFLTIVAPVWIGFHYVTRWRMARSLSSARLLPVLDMGSDGDGDI